MIRVVSVPRRRPRLISGIVELLAFEVLVGQLVVHLGDGLDHRVAMLDRLVEELRRDVDDVDLVAQVVAVVDRLHLDQVDDALELVLATDRDLDRDRVRTESILDRLDTAPEVRSGTVELVDEAETRHAVSVGLAPDGL